MASWICVLQLLGQNDHSTHSPHVPSQTQPKPKHTFLLDPNQKKYPKCAKNKKKERIHYTHIFNIGVPPSPLDGVSLSSITPGHPDAVGRYWSDRRSQGCLVSRERYSLCIGWSFAPRRVFLVKKRVKVRDEIERLNGSLYMGYLWFIYICMYSWIYTFIIHGYVLYLK